MTGIEATLAMNVVGPFVLTRALRPVLEASAPARIVNVASDAYTMARPDPFDDVPAANAYLGIEVYARAKALAMLWTFALARRLAGTGVVANVTNPGMAWTPMTAAMAPGFVPAWMRPAWPIFRLFQKRASAEKASRSSVFLAMSDEAATLTGAYVEKNARVAATTAFCRTSRTRTGRTRSPRGWRTETRPRRRTCRKLHVRDPDAEISASRGAPYTF